MFLFKRSSKSKKNSSLSFLNTDIEKYFSKVSYDDVSKDLVKHANIFANNCINNCINGVVNE